MDAECRRLIDGNPNLLVPWYLMSSFLYYHLDDAVISDGLYDEICKRLARDWRKIKHRHKKLIRKEDLEAGTGYALAEHHYPSIIRSAAVSLLERSPR